MKYLPVILLLNLLSCTSATQKEWVDLFNEKTLEGWDTYIGPGYDSVQKAFTGSPVGLNNDPEQVFSVVMEDGNPALRISGKHFGGISTRDSFSDYHLQVEFKWGKDKWNPRKNSKRDSGILYHAVGPHGADGNFWMRSQELQVQEGDCGDYWGVAGGVFDIPAIQHEGVGHVYDPQGTMTTFRDKGPVGRRCIKSIDAEKPTGEWNTIDLYCYGDTSVHVINDVVVMVLFNSRQAAGDDTIPLTEGKIQIQSEGAEVFYRNIRIRPAQSIPEALLANR